MQIVLPPEIEQLVQRQIESGKYQSAVEVITAGILLLEQKKSDQTDIYQGQLPALQREAQIGWDAVQRGELVDGSTTMEEIRANLRSRYSSSEQ